MSAIDDTPYTPAAAAPSGIGGWLLVLCVLLLVLKPLGTGIGCLFLLPAWLDNPAIGGFSLVGLRVLEAGLGLIAGLLLVFRWRHAPLAAKGYLILECLLLLTSAVILAGMTGVRAAALLRTGARILFNVAWFAYLVASKRVEATYAEGERWHRAGSS